MKKGISLFFFVAIVLLTSGCAGQKQYEFSPPQIKAIEERAVREAREKDPNYAEQQKTWASTSVSAEKKKSSKVTKKKAGTVYKKQETEKESASVTVTKEAADVPRREEMIITHQPGLIELLLKASVAIVSGLCEALVGGPDIVETPEQYRKRLEIERENRVKMQIVHRDIIYYDPYLYPPPFWPAYPIQSWYIQPAYPDFVFFIGRDGRHHRHHHHHR